VIQDHRSDDALQDVIDAEGVSERKKATASEILRRRHQEKREAWLARHGLIAAVIAAFAALAGFFARKRR
jgi:hypothetical protein